MKYRTRLSRKADYALRAIRHCTRLPKDQFGSISEIAAAEMVPRQFLARILSDLTQGGILISHRGVKGGYRLARKPREISFLDVIETIDGSIQLNLGRHRKNCEISKFWGTQEDMMIKALRKQHFGMYVKKTTKKK